MQNSYRQVNAICLSESGDVMACGMADSTAKVFWLNPAKIKEQIGLGSDTSRVLTTDGLKVQLLSEILCGKGISLSKARQSTMLK